VFYYLVPDNESQDREVAALKRVCHRNQASCFMKLGRMKEALKEVEMALREKTSLLDGKSLLRRAQIQKELGEYESADSEAKKLLEAVKDEGVEILDIKDRTEFKGSVQQLIVEI